MSFNTTELIAYKTNAYLKKIRLEENLSQFLYMEKYKWENKLKEGEVNLEEKEELVRVSLKMTGISLCL
jgi:hypothetical protein